MLQPQQGMFLASETAGETAYRVPDDLVALLSGSVTNAGGGQAHDNMQPYTVLSFCIALQGLFPSRN